MNHTTIVIIAVIVLIAFLLLFYLIRGRKQHVAFGDAAAVPPVRPTPVTASPAADPIAPPTAAPPAAAPPPAPMPAERHGIGSEVTAAIEDVVDQFVGIDAHPSGQIAAVTSGDTLTLLKGLGPRAASLLKELGVTRFDQIAAWDASDVAAIDAQLGAFQGRILRDRWVEQARLLAKGDQASFEEQFGKLGG